MFSGVFIANWSEIRKNGVYMHCHQPGPSEDV